MNSYDAENHVYYSLHGRLPGATDAIKAGGLLDVSYMSMDARWRGKCVHRAIELLNRKDLDWDTLDPAFHGYVRSYESFISLTGFEVVGCESPVFSQSFACLPDVWGVLNKIPTIIELKTGAIPAWAAFQTALQRRALHEDKGFKAIKRFGLQLLVDGKVAKLESFEDPKDDYRAMGLVDMWHWQKENKQLKEWR